MFILPALHINVAAPDDPTNRMAPTRVPRTGFKTGFDAKSSEKSVGKAAGGKGSEAC
jgi:hypothetical protein